MKLPDFGLLTDENIDPEVVANLRLSGFDVSDVCENGWQGSTDVALMHRAFQDQRVIVTHDADFGTLALLTGEPIVGLFFLRPGHIDPKFTVETIKTVFVANPEVTPPFILVSKRSGGAVTIRIRNLGP